MPNVARHYLAPAQRVNDSSLRERPRDLRQMQVSLRKFAQIGRTSVELGLSQDAWESIVEQARPNGSLGLAPRSSRQDAGRILRRRFAPWRAARTR